MARGPKQYDDDDGRTIVDMDVEGMPWHSRRIKKAQREQYRAELQEKIDRGEALTKKETFRYTFYAVLAGLTVVAVVGGGTVLFVFILWLLWGR